MNCKEIDLNLAIAEHEKSLRRILGDAIELDIQPAAPTVRLPVDETAIAQILTALIENARKSLPGGGVVSIQVEHIDVDEIHARIHPGARCGQFVRLTVIDNGRGFRAERLAKLFAQLPASATSRPANVLALPLIAGYVKRRGGWIEAHSHTGDGTTIHLYFPTMKSHEEPAVAPGKPETILLVDDEVPIRRMIKSVLERASYRVIEADTAVQALAVWDDCKDHVNLLLTDMVMPDGLTGRDLAQRLLATKPDLKVIYSSGFDLDELARQDTATGTVRFLHKPYDMRCLLETVHLAINGEAQTSPTAVRN